MNKLSIATFVDCANKLSVIVPEEKRDCVKGGIVLVGIIVVGGITLFKSGSEFFDKAK